LSTLLDNSISNPFQALQHGEWYFLLHWVQYYLKLIYAIKKANNAEHPQVKTEKYEVRVLNQILLRTYQIFKSTNK
jgi:hypothetical protein